MKFRAPAPPSAQPRALHVAPPGRPGPATAEFGPHPRRPEPHRTSTQCGHVPNALREQLRRPPRPEPDWTDERLAYARDQLAAATSSARHRRTTAGHAAGREHAAEIDIAHRVRAIEQSGGAAALYSQALDADAITDVTSNVAALNGVLATDLIRADDTQAASAQMANSSRQARPRSPMSERCWHAGPRPWPSNRGLLSPSNAPLSPPRTRGWPIWRP